MRLINARSLDLVEFIGDDIPKYAILSHTWEKDEASYKDWADPILRSRKAGFAKIRGACKKTVEHGLDWLWVDTNCIDKSSSAELSEAINSMFQWYAHAEICFAYLSDVPALASPVVSLADNEPRLEELAENKFRNSRWFTRGWTLQELLAPPRVAFYADDWTYMGNRDDINLRHNIAAATGINDRFLTRQIPITAASIAKKMSWLSRRETTRAEDAAYCMLGLFDINIPLLYGEGALKAFTRLQEELIKVSNDHSIFCWSWTDSVPPTWTSMLAPSPDTFAHASAYGPTKGDPEISVYAMTNAGLSIRLPVIYAHNAQYLAVLNARTFGPLTGPRQNRACIGLSGQQRGRVLHVRRPAALSRHPLEWNVAHAAGDVAKQDLMVMKRSTVVRLTGDALQRDAAGYRARLLPFGLVLTYESPELLAAWRRAGVESTHPTGVFSDAHGTVKLDPAGEDVGACLLTIGPGINLEHNAAIHLFVAVRVSTDRTPAWFCQLFTEENERHEDRARMYKNLVNQVNTAAPEKEQRAHYSPALDLSVVIALGSWMAVMWSVRVI
ncbi:heterokaryon incompatibility protein-domain-containing protein [Cercophora scortea]|uniref:Heterokaryon incompatibility protein-domain-containing protein n=1 Tax=Cercophora scortea TaxID=314031 RepID=A0AAE0J082_9PEZI|nr:heterokaryon incompatibility protein-domain-containing protein [Cercophora scortea]